MPQRIFTVSDRADLEKCFSVMKELRPHLTLAEYIAIYEEARQEGNYTIIALEENNQILALMGYRKLTDFVRGRHLYIDDLVVTEKARSKGLGAVLLKQAEQIAQEKGYKVLRLCTGIENKRGMNFYETHSWTKRAYAYTKKI